MDRYPNCDNQVYDGYLLPNVPTCISSANSMAEDYLSAKYVKAFLKRGFVCMTLTTKAALSKTVMESLNKLLSTTTNEDTQDNHSLKDPILSNLEPSPSLFFLLDEEGNRRYLGRGEIIYGKLVRDQERIRWGAQSKGGIDSKPSMRKHGWKLFRVFINHRLYKLDEESLIHFLGDTNCRSLLLIGSGGSPQKAGGSSHNIPSIHREERIIGSMSHDQRMNHMNQTMIEAAMNNRCISIWLGAETYNHLKRRKELVHVNLPEMNDDDFYHLGYFEVGAYFSSEPKTLKEIQREYLSVVEQNIPIDIQKQRMKRWSECRAVVIRCSLLPDDLLDCLPMMCSQKKRLVSKRPLRQIVVLDTPKMKVQIKCHREDLSQKL
jgi:hypothetical protein